MLLLLFCLLPGSGDQPGQPIVISKIKEDGVAHRWVEFGTRVVLYICCITSAIILSCHILIKIPLFLTPPLHPLLPLSLCVFRTGTMKVGDRILAINGESLYGKTITEAVAMLSGAGDIVSLKISKATRKHSEYCNNSC